MTPFYPPSQLKDWGSEPLCSERRLTPQALAAHNRRHEDWNETPLGLAQRKTYVHSYPEHRSGIPIAIIGEGGSSESNTTINDSSMENNDRLSREHFPSEGSEVWRERKGAGERTGAFTGPAIHCT